VTDDRRGAVMLNELQYLDLSVPRKLLSVND
jgi:hypothetical protein